MNLVFNEYSVKFTFTFFPHLCFAILSLIPIIMRFCGNIAFPIWPLPEIIQWSLSSAFARAAADENEPVPSTPEKSNHVRKSERAAVQNRTPSKDASRKNASSKETRSPMSASTPKKHKLAISPVSTIKIDPHAPKESISDSIELPEAQRKDSASIIQSLTNLAANLFGNSESKSSELISPITSAGEISSDPSVKTSSSEEDIKLGFMNDKN